MLIIVLSVSGCGTNVNEITQKMEGTYTYSTVVVGVTIVQMIRFYNIYMGYNLSALQEPKEYYDYYEYNDGNLRLSGGACV